ncbi:MAG: CBS domain-containing protein [Nitrospinota bacterium]|nr:MAG: CBS domain-containing protein [Nitrospinota bacterium]
MSREGSAQRKRWYSLADRLAQILDRWQPAYNLILLLSAVLVGVGTGLGAVFFIRMIALFNELSFGPIQGEFAFLGRFSIVLVPVLGGLLAGPLITYLASEAKGHGVPEVMMAIALQGGRIRPRVVVVKALASSFCIGSGGSAGREGPIVQIGASFGSTIGQLFKMSEQRIKNLVACGAAAGIAATFNAPIAGVIFSLEVILGEFSIGNFSTVVISAVTASVISRVFLGDTPAFIIPEYSLHDPRELIFYVLLGLLSAFAALLFVNLLYKLEDLFDEWKFPDALKPAVGGIFVGLIGIYYSHVFGSGFETIERALTSDLPLYLLLILMFMKILATSFTLGSGNSGGVFAPALFTGAMLGGAFGTVMHTFFPDITASSGAYAVVGMSAVFSAAARAPITGILILFEMTNDYRIILPLMISTVISTMVAECFQKDSIYTLKLTRRGVRLVRGRMVDIMEGILVGEAMSVDVETVPMDMPVRDVAQKLTRSHHHGFIVLDEKGELYGIVSLQDVEKALSNGRVENLRAKDIATTSLLTVYPHDTLLTALERLDTRDVGRLPVVDPQNPKKIVGLIRRYDIIRAYHRAILRRETIQQRLLQRQAEEKPEVDFMEFDLNGDSPAVGKRVDQLPLPQDAVLVAIRRDGQTLIPHGNTSLKTGDHITVFATKACVEELEHCFVNGR